MGKEQTHPYREGDGVGQKMDMAKQKTTVKMSASKGVRALSKEEAGKVVTYRVLIILLVNLVIGSLIDFIRNESMIDEPAFLYRSKCHKNAA